MFYRSAASGKPSGVSIIEVLMALAVLTFGLAYLIQLQTSTVRRSGEQRMRTKAQLLACEKAEGLRAAPFEALQQAALQGSEIPLESPKAYRCFAEVAAVDDIDKAIRIRSVVEWGSAGDAPRRAEYLAYAFGPQ